MEGDELDRHLKIMALDLEADKAESQEKQFTYQRAYWASAVAIGVAAVLVKFFE